MSTTTGSVVIRPARVTDQSYVAKTWATALSIEQRPVAVLHYVTPANNHLVDQLLDHPDMRVVVACEPTDSDRIVGWLAHLRMPGAHVLAWVSVRHARRNEGICTALRKDAGLLDVTRLCYLFETPSSRKWLPAPQVLLNYRELL